VTPALTATTIVLVLVGVYVLACWLWPFGKCRFCQGRATRNTLIRRRIRPCRWCKASGKRLRHGRRIFNCFRKVYAR
jgi:hypothetical protein